MNTLNGREFKALGRMANLGGVFGLIDRPKHLVQIVPSDPRTKSCMRACGSIWEVSSPYGYIPRPVWNREVDMILGGVSESSIVFQHDPGFSWSYREVSAPGIDARTAAWLAKRMLQGFAIGESHSVGHVEPTRDHFVVSAQDHGVQSYGWADAPVNWWSLPDCGAKVLVMLSEDIRASEGSEIFSKGLRKISESGGNSKSMVDKVVHLSNSTWGAPKWHPLKVGV